MASQDKKEILRKSVRIKLDLHAAISITAPGKRISDVISVSIKTLSGGGMMIVSPVPLREGSIVEMTLFFQSSAIPFIAAVVWTEDLDKKKEKKFRCGLTFRSISDDDLLTIQNFVHKQMQISPNSAA